MNNKSLQEAKELNAKARQNMNPDGTSKVSLTQGTMTNEMVTSSTDYGVEEAKELNNKSGLSKK